MIKSQSEDLRQSKGHPRSKVEGMLGKLGREEADKDEVGRSAWVGNTFWFGGEHMPVRLFHIVLMNARF